jgi:IclR family acetate operon transcriptional repressor
VSSANVWRTPREGALVAAEGPSLIQLVRRALRLVEIIAEHDGRRAHPKEIARAAGLPLATTYHLLRTCAHEGWLQRLDDGSYVLGHRLDVIREHGTAARGVAQARPAMEWLRDELGGAVYLARRYLARHPLHDLTPRTVVDRRRLRLPEPGDLAVDEGEYALGVSCLAAPVLTGREVGAVAVVTGRSVVRRAPTVRDTARRDGLRRSLRAGAARVARALAVT